LLSPQQDLLRRLPFVRLNVLSRTSGIASHLSACDGVADYHGGDLMNACDTSPGNPLHGFVRTGLGSRLAAQGSHSRSARGSSRTRVTLSIMSGLWSAAAPTLLQICNGRQLQKERPQLHSPLHTCHSSGCIPSRAQSCLPWISN